ncbi:MAG: FadR family transcriptional regulator [Chloroflexi bacterium]|nr:FadR family transcriptional regulator [Chloroflexota bacterium]
MNKPAFRLARRATLSEDICQQLVNLIASGELPPGSKLPSEYELMSKLGVGRSSVREALRALSLLGMIETRQGDGAYVAGRDTDSFRKSITWHSLVSVQTGLEFIEARKVVELGVIELAAQRATPEDIAQLEQLVTSMVDSMSDVDRFAELDTAFHTMLAEIAGNNLLLQFLINLRDLLHRFILGDLRKSTPSEIPQYVAEHKAVVQAIKDGEVALAAQILRKHMDDVAGRLRTSIAEEEKESGR